MSDINLARLTFQMAADVAQLTRDMSTAKSTVNEAMGNIKSQVEMVKSAFAGLAGAFAVNEIVAMVTKVIDAGEKLHDLSLVTGATVESLSALSSIGKLTGTSTETIADAMNKMAKNTSAANEESKGAAAALKALGIDFNNFVGMTPDQKMLAVAEAMSHFQDGSGKSAAAMALMGRSGAELLPYMKDLAEAGELHARVTTQQAQTADEFNDNLVKLKGSSEAWKKSMTMELLPALRDITIALLEAKSSSADTGSSIGGFLSESLRWAAASVNVLWMEFKGLGIVLKGVYDMAFSPWDQTSSIFNKMNEDLSKLRDSTVSANNAIMGLTSNAGAGRGGTSATDPRSLGIGEDFRKQIDLSKVAIDSATDSANKAIDAWNGVVDTIAKLEAEFDAMILGGEKLTAAQKAQIDAYVKLDDYLDRYTVDELVQIDTDWQAVLAKEALIAANKQQADAIKALAKIYDEYLAAQIKSAQAVEETVAKEREAVAAMGLSKEALGELQAAKYRDLAASLEREAAVRGEQGADEATVELLKRQAAAYRELGDLKQAGGIRQAALDAAAEFKKTSDGINNTLTDALMRGFESGKSFAAVFRDTVVNMFKTMVLRPVISAIMSPVSMGLTALMGGSSAAAGTMGAVGSGNSVEGLLSGAGALFGAGGLGGSLMAGAGWMTGATTLSGSLSAAASLVGTEGGLMAGLGMGAGALGPIALGAVLLSQLFKSKGGPKQEGGYSLAGLNAVPDQNWASLWSTSGGVSTMGESGTAKGMADSISAAYGQVAKALGLANTALNVGLSYVMDPNGTSQTQLQIVTGNYNRGARMGGTENVARGEDALKAAIADETARVILAELQANIGGSVGDALNRIDATRAAAGDINDLITGLEGVYKMLQDTAKLTYSLEPMGGVFGRIATLGVDAKNSLIEMAGGVDALIAKSQKFVDLYYSDTERGAISAKQILDATSGLGLGGIGGISTLADYRALVESQNVGSEDGRRAVNTLLDLAPTFANIAKLLGGDSGLTLAALAGQAANTPAADFLRQLSEANGGDTGKTTADLMQSWLDQSQRASDTLNGLIERLISVTADAANAQIALLSRTADASAASAATSSLALQDAAT